MRIPNLLLSKDLASQGYNNRKLWQSYWKQSHLNFTPVLLCRWPLLKKQLILEWRLEQAAIICISNHTVPSRIWPTFSAFLMFSWLISNLHAGGMTVKYEKGGKFWPSVMFFPAAEFECWCILVKKYNTTNISVFTAWKVFVFGVFLVNFSPHLDWMRRVSDGPEKLRIWTLFKQWRLKYWPYCASRTVRL